LNESENLPQLFSTLEEFSKKESRYRFEFFFTDNSSQDNTWSIIQQKSLSDHRFKGIRFTRNIGFNNSILVNLLNAGGEALIQFDADLQDPITIVSHFLRKWESGHKVVVGKRMKREEHSLLTLFRRIGYHLLNKISDNSLPLGVGDFKLLDREVVAHLRAIRNPDPYLRGIIAEMNFPTASIPYVRKARLKGKSKFNILKLIKFGASAFADHSKITLKILWIAVISLSVLISGLSCFYVWQAMHSLDWPQGLLTMYLLQLITLQLLLLSFTIVLTYVIRTYKMISGTPRFLVTDTTINSKGIIKPG
jgi:dolichol-phosphate mannosyltransferase